MIALVVTAVVALVSGGAGGAVLTLWMQHRRSKREQADARRFLAHTLAFVFEGYAIACAGVLSDGESYGPDADEPGSMGSLPEVPSLPQSAAYQWIESELLERIFAFPQDIAVARDGLAYIWRVADMGDYDDQARETLADFGLRATAIAADLRASNAIAPRVLESGRWQIRSFLEQHAKDQRNR